MPFIIRVDAVRSETPSGNRDQHVGRHDAHIGIGALRPDQIADAITDADVGHSRADRFDNANRIRTDAIGQLQRISAGAEIDVDEIDRDIGVADTRLPRSGLADLDCFELEDFRAADFVKADRLGHCGLAICLRFF